MAGIGFSTLFPLVPQAWRLLQTAMGVSVRMNELTTAKQARPLVSVILAYHDSARYLEEAVVSILCQSWSNWELIMVDDGSTDGGSELARQITVGDSRVHHYFLADGPHGHVGTGRNVGLAHASGSLVTFQDGDDYSYPERLERQLAWLETHPQARFVSCLV